MIDRDDKDAIALLVGIALVLAWAFWMALTDKPEPRPAPEVCRSKTHEADGRPVSCYWGPRSETCICTYKGEPIQ